MILREKKQTLAWPRRLFICVLSAFLDFFTQRYCVNKKKAVSLRDFFVRATRAILINRVGALFE